MGVDVMGYGTKTGFKCALLATTALALGSSGTALAAEEADEAGGVGIIIVTAQKREQNVQDVPIAVTALGTEVLEANRVSDVLGLTGLAPGLTVTESAGGQKIPFFLMRGASSTGLVPGSDKQVSLYLDGVYLSSTRGSIFDLPNVERIEVLRGPQGTLFGRNATAGAVSITTSDPTGEIGMKMKATVGNYGHYRIHAGLELPQFGPFSGYVSYVRNYKRGDIRNVAAGQVWDRTNSFSKRTAKIEKSPRFLGTTDSHSVFAALKFESGDFTTVYKFDWMEDSGSARGTGLVGYNDGIPLLGAFIDTMIQTQPNPVPINASGLRPKSVSNGFVIPTDQSSQGHSLTSTYQISDNLSVKNIFAYRKSFISGASSIDGVSSLIITPQSILPFAVLSAFSTLPPAQAAAAIPSFIAALSPLIGSPWIGIGSQTMARSSQISDELQFNYESDFLTATVGAVWFQSKDHVNESRQQNTITFAPIFGGVIPNTNIGNNYNKAISIAAYAQLEFHLTPQLDIVAGGRITQDKKSGSFLFGPDLASLQLITFTYKKSKPSFLIGVNWKPTDDILVYGKFSTAYVSGGSVASLDFLPETVKSWEAGIKTEFFNRKLRANLALFHASYKHVQGPSAPTSPEARQLVINASGSTELPNFIGTFVADLGSIKAKGFEFDFAAAPVTGLTFGGTLSYTDTDYVFIHPLQIAADGILPQLSLRPPWRGSLYAQYDTAPIGFGDAYVSFRGDAFWQDGQILTPRPDDPIYSSFAAPIRDVGAYWLINGRVALKDVEVSGANVEFAIWGKNLADKRHPSFGLNLGGILASANYIPARTYGLDVTLEF